MWSFTDPVWATIFVWATILAAVFGGIGVICLFVSGWVGYQITGVSQRKANVQIAEANARALEAKLALARFQQPRLLSEEAMARIVDKVKIFKDVEFDCAGSPTHEATNLLTSIEDTLERAGWMALNNAGAVSITIPNRRSRGIIISEGVSISFDQSQNPHLEKPVLALANALNDEGIAVSATGNAATPINKQAIHVIVGAKP